MATQQLRSAQTKRRTTYDRVKQEKNPLRSRHIDRLRAQARLLPIFSPLSARSDAPPSSCTVWQPLVLLNRQELCKRGLCNKMASASSAVKKPNSKAYLSVMVLYGCGRVDGPGSRAFYLSPSLGIMQARPGQLV